MGTYSNHLLNSSDVFNDGILKVLQYDYSNWATKKKTNQSKSELRTMNSSFSWCNSLFNVKT